MIRWACPVEPMLDPRAPIVPVSGLPELAGLAGLICAGRTSRSQA